MNSDDDVSQKTTSTYGMTDGAIDNEFDEAELSPREVLEQSVENTQREPVEGGVAVDLVTRQPLFVRRKKYETLVEHYEDTGFNLLDYKGHPWLPVRIDDAVFECVFISGDPGEGHKAGKTYDYPRGRLMTLPVWLAWEDDE